MIISDRVAPPNRHSPDVRSRLTVKRVNLVHLDRLALNAAATAPSEIHKALLHDLMRLSVFSAYSALRK